MTKTSTSSSYDVLGDVVCGGFAMPIRENKARKSTSSVRRDDGHVRRQQHLKGHPQVRQLRRRAPRRLICNSRNTDREDELIMAGRPSRHAPPDPFHPPRQHGAARRIRRA